MKIIQIMDVYIKLDLQWSLLHFIQTDTKSNDRTDIIVILLKLDLLTVDVHA